MTFTRVTGRKVIDRSRLPALDGLRGIGITVFIAYHFGATWLVGGWATLNLFFVLSAYLLTRILAGHYLADDRVGAWAFYRRRARRLLPGLFLLLVVLVGYGWFFADPLIRSGPSSRQCAAAKSNMTQELREHSAQVLFFMPGPELAAPHVEPGGTRVTLQDAVYRNQVVAALTHLQSQATAAGAQFQIATIPCRDPDAMQWPGVYQVLVQQSAQVWSQMHDPVLLNTMIKDWAAAHGVPVIDLYAQLCSTGYRPSVRGLRLYVDSLHFSDRAAPMLWSWMAPLLRDNDLRESTH